MNVMHDVIQHKVVLNRFIQGQKPLGYRQKISDNKGVRMKKQFIKEMLRL